MDGYVRNQIWDQARRMRQRDQKMLQEIIEMKNCRFEPKKGKKGLKRLFNANKMKHEWNGQGRIDVSLNFLIFRMV